MVVVPGLPRRPRIPRRRAQVTEGTHGGDRLLPKPPLQREGASALVIAQKAPSSPRAQEVKLCQWAAWRTHLAGAVGKPRGRLGPGQGGNRPTDCDTVSLSPGLGRSTPSAGPRAELVPGWGLNPRATRPLSPPPTSGNQHSKAGPSAWMALGLLILLVPPKISPP